MKLRALALMLVLGSVAVVASVGGPVFAEGDDKVRGFVTYGTGEVSGRVTDESGTPMANAEVHIVSGAAVEQIVKSGADGKFKITVGGGGTSWVFVLGRTKITGQTILSPEGDSGIVEILEAIPPAVMPRPLSNPLAILGYSDEAIEHNTWTRAWLMLDVDATGSVQQLKLLASPGFGLDPIAIREGFKLRFKPALDRVQKPTSALVVWVFEWPAYYWLLEQASRQDNTMSRMPKEARGVPCRGSGPTHSTYRECSRPALSKAMSQPWIERPKP